MTNNTDQKHNKTAVVLLNLGGPDKLSSVRTFLFNMFSDRAIIRLPLVFRYLLAQFISRIREKKSQKIYAKIGGRSPLLEETNLQSAALEKMLNSSNSQKNDIQNKKIKKEFRTFVAMRYWHPFIKEACADVAKYQPDEIILLPLYPQFSTTTTQSSFDEWDKEWDKVTSKNPKPSVHKIISYHDDDLFIAGYADLLLKTYEEMLHKLDKNQSIINKTVAVKDQTIILFSAHGLPQSVIDDGDQYQKQTEESVEAIMRKFEQLMLEKTRNIGEDPARKNNKQSSKNQEFKPHYRLCYQSKVGPMKWLEPSSENEIISAAKDNMAIIVLPISFVSEHSETLVELDIDYRILAEDNGAAAYMRVPTLRDHSLYIECLADLCKAK